MLREVVVGSGMSQVQKRLAFDPPSMKIYIGVDKIIFDAVTVELVMRVPLRICNLSLSYDTQIELCLCCKRCSTRWESNTINERT